MGIATMLASAADFVGSVFSRRDRRPGMPVIDRPVLGILNLDPERFDAMVAEDRAAFDPLFETVMQSDREPPRCDVLLLYCSLDLAGQVKRTTSSLGKIIADSGACIVIFAVGNTGDAYVHTGHDPCSRSVNLVKTLDRKGDGFPTYFTRLFKLMFEGMSMPLAWVTLSPQAPGLEHEGPSMYMACGYGQVAFRAS